MHGRCFCCTSHTFAMLSWLMSGTPRVSVRSHIASRTAWISVLDSSTPLVRRLQCFASSDVVMLSLTCDSVGMRLVPLLNSLVFASLSSSMSTLSHSKMALESFDRKVPKREWCSVVSPATNLLIKWKISSFTKDLHGENMASTGGLPVNRNNIM